MEQAKKAAMQRVLKIEKSKRTPEELKASLDRYFESIGYGDSYEAFRNRIYGYINEYKKRNITRECGTYRGIVRKEILPDSFCEEDVPAMLYPGIREAVYAIQQSVFKYKPHLFAYRHIASSQTACVNLFVPVLESCQADSILKAIKACPKDFDHVERQALYNGYRFEFWDSVDENEKGLLGDHSKQAGTDADVAIAYRNTDGDLCLWLIEHKLTEKEFTTCGAYKSKGNSGGGRQKCLSCSIKDILSDHSVCYYDRVNHYNYWTIMSEEGAGDFFSGDYEGTGCPFRGGMNQLWRNQLLAIALERQGTYKSVCFSVVTHPENHFLDESMSQYRKLVKDSPKFSSFKSSELIDAAESYQELQAWVAWYSNVYYGKTTACEKQQL